MTRRGARPESMRSPEAHSVMDNMMLFLLGQETHQGIFRLCAGGDADLWTMDCIELGHGGTVPGDCDHLPPWASRGSLTWLVGSLGFTSLDVGHRHGKGDETVGALNEPKAAAQLCGSLMPSDL